MRMANVTLKSVLGPKTGAAVAIAALDAAMGCTLGIEDASGKSLLLDSVAGPARMPIILEGSTLGWATEPPAAALASLLVHLAAQETERRSLASQLARKCLQQADENDGN